MTIEYTDPATPSSNGGKQPTKAPVRVFSDNGIDEEVAIETIDDDRAAEPVDHPEPGNPDAPDRPVRTCSRWTGRIEAAVSIRPSQVPAEGPPAAKSCGVSPTNGRIPIQRLASKLTSRVTVASAPQR